MLADAKIDLLLDGFHGVGFLSVKLVGENDVADLVVEHVVHDAHELDGIAS